MEYTGKIGAPVIPEKERRLYSETAHEYLILTAGNGAGASHVPPQKYWTAYIDMLGYVDLTDGRECDIRASARWVLTDEEEQSRSFQKVFNSLTVYRIKAFPAKAIGDPQADNPVRMAGLYVTEVLAEGEANAFLQGLLDAYNKVETLHSDVFGDLILNKELESLDVSADWCGTETDISLQADDPDADLKEGLRLLEAFFAEQEKWDAELRSYAAAELTELANEWATDEDENAPEITEEDFAKRLIMSGIVFEPDGTFTVYFDDDDMFWGHSVTVYGDMEEGPNDAQMEG